MIEKLSDSWRTPERLFDKLNREFKFDVDLCATKDNTLCKIFGKDYLENIFMMNLACCEHPYVEWDYHNSLTCFMNPPYSNPKPFIEKAWEDSKMYKIVCLVKADTSTKWWGIFWDYVLHKPKDGCEIRFFPKRIKFDPPKGYVGNNTSAAFPSALIVMDRRGESI